MPIETIFLLFVLAALLQLADALTTIPVLRHPRGKEANPLVARFVRALGPVGAMVATKLPALAVLAWMWTGRATADADVLLAVLVAACAVYAYAVWNNLRVIRRLREIDAAAAARHQGAAGG